MRRQYRRLRVNGLIFLFAFDADDPELLHIYVRHLATEIDALRVFFDAERRDEWNEERQRWESRNATHLLLWFWRIPKEVVVVISCMKL